LTYERSIESQEQLHYFRGITLQFLQELCSTNCRAMYRLARPDGPSPCLPLRSGQLRGIRSCGGSGGTGRWLSLPL